MWEDAYVRALFVTYIICQTPSVTFSVVLETNVFTWAGTAAEINRCSHFMLPVWLWLLVTKGSNPVSSKKPGIVVCLQVLFTIHIVRTDLQLFLTSLSWGSISLQSGKKKPYIKLLYISAITCFSCFSHWFTPWATFFTPPSVKEGFPVLWCYRRIQVLKEWPLLTVIIVSHAKNSLLGNISWSFKS